MLGAGGFLRGSEYRSHRGRIVEDFPWRMITTLANGSFFALTQLTFLQYLQYFSDQRDVTGYEVLPNARTLHV